MPDAWRFSDFPICRIVIEFTTTSAPRKIEEKLKNNEQVLLIQNRRGHSPTIKCSDCGSIVMCSACKTPLTFHKYDNKLKCHICGFIGNKELDSCQECFSQNFLYLGTGTQKVENILKQTFPNARIARVDHDSTKKNSSVVKILQSFLNGEIDILLGTQMISKGLDFPGITLVGIINADLGLHIPDFRASERTFQLIYQAAGRAGRGEKEGEVIIQTYDKENTVIKAASKLDNGSSNKNTFGFLVMALPIATLCLCPPDNCFGFLSKYSSI